MTIFLKIRDEFNREVWGRYVCQNHDCVLLRIKGENKQVWAGDILDEIDILPPDGRYMEDDFGIYKLG